ncbi:class I SAM-dependent methyltransferase [Janibacter sp. G1551]|uniref:class I SAM-dependent methyltransferase n=1 Tax=Janibacter sp. G1551 TaxID=3420440 RepID=UPI003D06CB7A
MDGDVFGGGRSAWLDRAGLLRNVLRQEIVARQLAQQLPGDADGLTALDVGAGQGTQAISLARRGIQVDAVEPDAQMRAALTAAVADEGDDVRARVRVLDGSLDTLSETGRSSYDVVLCHGVLMYLEDTGPALAALAAKVPEGGLLSVLTRQAVSLAWRPAQRGDWSGVTAALEEQRTARAESRRPAYLNELGVPAHADDPESLAAALTNLGITGHIWHGVRVASDAMPADAPVPSDPELEALIAAELALGAREPYRRMATLFHLVSRRAALT